MSAYSPSFAAPVIPDTPIRYLETFAAASSWVVNHNLGREPSAQVLTLGGVEMLADVQHTSLNQLVVYFSQPQAGKVVLF